MYVGRGTLLSIKDIPPFLHIQFLLLPLRRNIVGEIHCETVRHGWKTFPVASPVKEANSKSCFVPIQLLLTRYNEVLYGRKGVVMEYRREKSARKDQHESSFAVGNQMHAWAPQVCTKERSRGRGVLNEAGWPALDATILGINLVERYVYLLYSLFLKTPGYPQNIFLWSCVACTSTSR